MYSDCDYYRAYQPPPPPTDPWPKVPVAKPPPEPDWDEVDAQNNVDKSVKVFNFPTIHNDDNSNYIFVL